jgi:hypothetical protein
MMTEARANMNMRQLPDELVSMALEAQSLCDLEQDQKAGFTVSHGTGDIDASDDPYVMLKSFVRMFLSSIASLRMLFCSCACSIYFKVVYLARNTLLRRFLASGISY